MNLFLLCYRLFFRALLDRLTTRSMACCQAIWGLFHTMHVNAAKKERRQVNEKFCELKCMEYRDAIKSKETR